MAVPVVFDTSVRPIFARPKFTVAAVGAALLAVLGAVQWVRRPPPFSRRNRLAVAVLVVLSWTAVAAAFSSDPRTSVLGGSESINGLVTAAVLALAFFAAAGAFERPQVRMVVTALWFGATGIVLLYGAVQLAGWDPVDWRNTPEEWVVWSTLGNPNDLAGFLAMVLPLGLVTLLRARTPVVASTTAVMVALSLVELTVTTSRGGLLAAAAGVLTVAFALRRELRARARLVVPAAGAVLAVAAAVIALLFATGRSEREVGQLTATGEGTTASLRVELWRTAWRMAVDHPVTGVGPDNFAGFFDEYRSDRFVRVFGPNLLATDPHNVFVDALATQGAPGLAAFVFLVGTTFALVRRGGGEDDPLPAAVGAALLAYLVQASFNRHDISLEFCAWVLLGLACVLCRSPRPARSPGAGAGGRRPRR